jgi:hypothetical protein
MDRVVGVVDLVVMGCSSCDERNSCCDGRNAFIVNGIKRAPQVTRKNCLGLMVQFCCSGLSTGVEQEG